MNLLKKLRKNKENLKKVQEVMESEIEIIDFNKIIVEFENEEVRDILIRWMDISIHLSEKEQKEELKIRLDKIFRVLKMDDNKIYQIGELNTDSKDFSFTCECFEIEDLENGAKKYTSVKEFGFIFGLGMDLPKELEVLNRKQGEDALSNTYVYYSNENNSDNPLVSYKELDEKHKEKRKISK